MLCERSGYHSAEADLAMSSQHTIRLGMVGGGRDAFIGAVHRMAARLDGRYAFIAGALSSTPEKSLASGRDLGLADDRNYPTWRAMVEGESRLPAERRIQAVSIVTPNDTHFEIARAFADAGFNVILDKPMVHSTRQAGELSQVVRSRGVVFCVTYNYTGYPMVRQAREMVRAGELGAIRKVIVEYNQGWLASSLESTGQKQAGWRTDPSRSGLGGAIGDIGTHAENLLATITGLTIESLCADLTTFVPGRRLDDDANILLRLSGGAKGILTASQVCIGSENDLHIRVWGDKGGLDWRQEEPNSLIHSPANGPQRILRRGHDYLTPAAKAATRLPSGHPEAFIEAFANVYSAVAEAIAAKSSDAGSHGVTASASTRAAEFPGIVEGSRGVAFIEAVVESSRSGGVWKTLPTVSD